MQYTTIRFTSSNQTNHIIFFCHMSNKSSPSTNSTHPYRCMLCGETFAEEAVIKRHITNVHGAELTSNSCRLCGKLCRDSRTLMKHSWEHSSEKNHSCSKCGKTFHNKARLKRHMQSHRNKSVTCDVCSEEFPDGRSLMNHRHSHTNVSGRQFPCKECGKTFGSRSSQQIHMRIHTGERPYGCRFCWKAFADGGTLRKHERIHTGEFCFFERIPRHGKLLTMLCFFLGEKPYACPICPRAFNQRVVLREHIRSHHSGPDSKNGSSATPFYCTVCGDSFGTSILLIQHLIEHSDMNTALKRQPPVSVLIDCLFSFILIQCLSLQSPDRSAQIQTSPKTEAARARASCARRTETRQRLHGRRRRRPHSGGCPRIRQCRRRRRIRRLHCRGDVDGGAENVLTPHTSRPRSTAREKDVV